MCICTCTCIYSHTCWWRLLVLRANVHKRKERCRSLERERREKGTILYFWQHWSVHVGSKVDTWLAWFMHACATLVQSSTFKAVYALFGGICRVLLVTTDRQTDRLLYPCTCGWDNYTIIACVRNLIVEACNKVENERTLEHWPSLYLPSFLVETVTAADWSSRVSVHIS